MRRIPEKVASEMCCRNGNSVIRGRLNCGPRNIVASHFRRLGQRTNGLHGAVKISTQSQINRPND